MVWYRLMPPVNIIALPVFVLLTFGASFGAGLWIAALMVENLHDFRFVVPFVVQFGLYASPVVLMTSRVPETWLCASVFVPARFLYSLNPVVGIIDGFRWCILGGENVIYLPGFAMSVAVMVFLVIDRPLVFPQNRTDFCGRHLKAACSYLFP